jgi:hypothetical protein
LAEERGSSVLSALTLGSTDLPSRSFLVEGKGVVYLSALNIRYYAGVTLQNAAN